MKNEIKCGNEVIMKVKLKPIVYILLICLCIGVFAGCCANSNNSNNSNKSSGNYEYYIKIYMPDGCVEGPGAVIIVDTCGLVLVEIDGIRYRVGSQNILIRELPAP